MRKPALRALLLMLLAVIAPASAQVPMPRMTDLGPVIGWHFDIALPDDTYVDTVRSERLTSVNPQPTIWMTGPHLSRLISRSSWLQDRIGDLKRRGRIQRISEIIGLKIWRVSVLGPPGRRYAERLALRLADGSLAHFEYNHLAATLMPPCPQLDERAVRNLLSGPPGPPVVSSEMADLLDPSFDILAGPKREPNIDELLAAYTARVTLRNHTDYSFAVSLVGIGSFHASIASGKAVTWSPLAGRWELHAWAAVPGAVPITSTMEVQSGKEYVFALEARP